MNRETKLALIIGFAFILVVGVLVSDYFSTAQRAELADLSGSDQLALAAPARAIAPPGYDARRPAATDASSRANPARTGPSPSSTDPLASPGMPWEEPGRATPPTTELFPPMIAESRRPVPPTHIAAPLEINQSPSVEPQAPAAREPEVVRHTVTDDDSLWDLAEQYYGKGSLWPRILEANRPAHRRDDPTIRTGEVLMIPPMTGPVQSASARRDAQQDPPRNGTPASPPPARTSTDAERTYTVKKGDALSLIAQRHLGTSKRMDEIIKLNRDQIADPDDIRIGMVLALPAR